MKNSVHNTKPFTGNAKTCPAKREIKGVKVASLATFFLRMKEEDKVQKLLDLMAAITAERSGFNPKVKHSEARNMILRTRMQVLSFQCVREDSLLETLFRKAFKEELGHSIKEYYKLCHKEHREIARQLSRRFFVIDTAI